MTSDRSSTDVPDEVYEAFVKKLELRVQEIGSEADRPLWICKCGLCDAVTPREILAEIKARTSKGRSMFQRIYQSGINFHQPRV